MTPFPRAFPPLLTILAFTLLLPAVPGPAAAERLGAMGQVTVRLEGFEGWYQTRKQDLEIHFAGRITTTNRSGYFRFGNLRSTNPEREFGIAKDFKDGRHSVYIEGRDDNYVRVLVGRKRVLLPITWRGEIRDRYMVLHAVECEIIPGGRGACEIVEQDLDAHERTMRERLYMDVPPRLAAPAQPSGKPAPAAKPATPAEPSPTAGGNSKPKIVPMSEPMGDGGTKPAKPAQPTKPKSPPKPEPDAPGKPEIKLIEPMD